jgi:hypothetical protein
VEMLAPIALVVAVVALGLALSLRGELARGREAANAAVDQAARASARAAEAERATAALRAQLEQAATELAALREAVESPPPLTLPKARRSAALDDLREQLRAAQQAEDEADEG